MPEPKYGYDNCAHCGKEFPKTFEKKIYCNSRCRQQAQNDNRRQQNPFPTCVYCGTTFHNYSGNQSYCSNGCKYKAKNKRQRHYSSHWEKCEWCSASFIKKYEEHRFCSSRCRSSNERYREYAEVREHTRELNAAKRKCAGGCGRMVFNYRCQTCWNKLLYGEQDSYETVDWGVECKM